MSDDIKCPATEHFKFHANTECEYFPCHEGADPGNFNCLFCYCPLYALGHECGGNFIYTEDGIKDCSKCLVPHSSGAYEHITSKCKLLIEMAKEK